MSAVSSLSVHNEPTVSDQLIVKMELQLSQSLVSTQGMLDTGAAGTAFINSSTAYHLELPLLKLKKPTPTDLADGSPGPNCTHYIRLSCKIGPYTETLSFFVMPLSYPIILGRG